MARSSPQDDLIAKYQTTYEKLRDIRASKTISLKPSPFFREEVLGFDGNMQPFKLRYYQSQGIYHLLLMPRMVLGDGTGLGKCVTGGTLLVTDQGMIPIRELGPDAPEDNTFYEPRFPVRVWNGKKFVQVKRFFWNGRTKTYKIRTQSGFVLEGSSEHPILTRQESGESFTKLSDLKKGQYACIDRSEAIFSNTEPTISLDWDLAVAKTSGLEGSGSYVDIARLLENHYFYDPIEEIVESEAGVMDLEVDDDSHCFSGNGFINHNTIEAIGAMCYIWQKEVDTQVIVIAPKSALRQWANELERFTKGVVPILAVGSIKDRERAYQSFFRAPLNGDKHVLLLNYHILIRDWKHGQVTPLLSNGRPDPQQSVVPGLLDRYTAEISKSLTVYFDEATAFKSLTTKTWEVCKFLSERSKRVYGLTATLLKNNLMEGFGIYKVIQPPLFSSKTNFMNTFCITKMQPIGGGRQIPIVVGYKNLDLFRSRIDPFFLGRTKQAVSDELPVLTTREIQVTLNTAEAMKYAEALKGVITLGDGEIKDFEEHKAFVSLIYCQQVVNSLHMLRFKEGDFVDGNFSSENDFEYDGKTKVSTGSKEQALIDLITEELDGEKVIVYTRFASLVPRLQDLLTQEKIKSARITGAVKEGDRQKAQAAFQNMESDTKVIFITDAGSEAINLQAASALVFFESPWSWGNYVQIIGRMIRIGSPHKGVLVYHLIAELEAKGKDRKTIDAHVLEMLRKKKNVIDRIIGEAAVGALEFEKGGGSTRELVRRLQGSVA